jgi:hypothetical protein
MRAIPLGFAAAALVVGLAVAGCGGSASDSLTGTWQEAGKGTDFLLIRLDDDGKWVADADGSLEDDVFTGGSYEREGQRVSFTPSEGGLCRGQTIAWDVDFPDNDTLDVNVVHGGCGLEEGRLKLIRVDKS